MNSFLCWPVFEIIRSPKGRKSNNGTNKDRNQQSTNFYLCGGLGERPIQDSASKGHAHHYTEGNGSKQCVGKKGLRSHIISMTYVPGPMIGLTNILATMTTVEFVIKPTPAKIEAITKRAMKSKLQQACS